MDWPFPLRRRRFRFAVSACDWVPPVDASSGSGHSASVAEGGVISVSSISESAAGENGVSMGSSVTGRPTIFLEGADFALFLGLGLEIRRTRGTLGAVDGEDVSGADADSSLIRV